MSAESFAAPAQATPNFDKLAHLYRWMEWASFGPFLSLCRNSFHRQLRHQNRALVFGDGDGRFTARLLCENQSLRADAVDASPAMLRALIHRTVSNAPRLKTSCLDARRWRAGCTKYDLIVTHFFLDCLTTAETQSLVREVRAASTPGALWVVSEFAIPQSWLGHLLAATLVRTLYLAFSWLTGLKIRQLPDHALAMSVGGFRLESRCTRLGGLLISELWEFANPQ